MAIVVPGQGGVRLAAVNATAAKAGVLPGLSLAESRALLPGLTAADADPVGEENALDRLADWCGRYTPWTATDKSSGDRGALGGGAGLWLNVSGCAALFGGERTLLEDLVARVARVGFSVIAAVADTPGAAWAVARFATGYDGRPVRIVPPGEAAAALAALPIAGLRLPPALVGALGDVGLRSIAALRAMPRASLATRFGADVLKRLDQALGETDEPLAPRRPVPPMIARLGFAEPIARPEDIARAARHLIGDLCVRLAQAHQGARRLELTLYRTDGAVSRAAVGASRPTRDSVHLQRLFREKWERLDPGFGVEVATLAATEVDPLAAVQIPLPSCRSTSDPESLAQLIDRLGNRLGAGNVNRLVGWPSHVPERACREAPAASRGEDKRIVSRGKDKRIASRGEDKGAAARREWRPAPPADETTPPLGDQQSRQPRPLLLLPWPEPIAVIAPVPDGPPVMFRRGRRRHQVRVAMGPERIGPEWWLENGGLDPLRLSRIRDYYRVEDSDGGRFWIFREGLYRPDIPARWYLHGLFP